MRVRSTSPRTAKTRAALLTAGLDLLVDRPVDGIVIDELVAAAGVAKGSFFNHFADKRAFARAIADDIRREVEACVVAANALVKDPLERLAGGMITAAAFAMREPKRAAVLARTAQGMMAAEHPLNRGMLEDMRACIAAGLVRPEAERAGVLFWLGCCHTIMSALAQQRLAPSKAADLLRDMLVLGLTGLGADGRWLRRFTDREKLLARLR